MNSKSVGIIAAIVLAVIMIGIGAYTMQGNEVLEDTSSDMIITEEVQSDEGKEFSISLHDGITTASP